MMLKKILVSTLAMMFPLIFMIMALFLQNHLVNGVYKMYDEHLLYDELIKVNASCYPLDSCKEERPKDSTGIPIRYSCSCDRDCSRFDSCCIDSPYKDDFLQMLECRNVGDSSASIGYYMVSRCGSHIPSNSIWKALCEAEWDEEDDLTKLAPVSSLESFTAYKNYYCFRCHETTDKFQYWNLSLAGYSKDSDRISKDSDFNVVYNVEKKTWIATSVEKAISIPVKLQFMLPYELKILPLSCNLGIVSDCSETWTEQNTRDKCHAYTAVVYSKYSNSRKYKNPHCAFCNFESLNDISCEPNIAGAFAGKEIFSFSHLLNINRPSDDKNKSQCDKNQLYDPYAKKCRKIACAIPGYVIKDGRCTLP